MKKRLLTNYLFFVFMTIYFGQSIFAQKSIGLNAEVKISISKRIGISIGHEILCEPKFTLSSSTELSKRDILITYKTIQNSTEIFSVLKPTLSIFRKNHNSSLSISNGSEKELRQVMYNDNILINIIDGTKKNNFPNKHLVTIVY
ncbi:MAG: hypothetical protein GY936_00970 [Ignavibacteriae bacterium]|nr:hypothetical protein [Ignavibacteriota bacterium]